MNICCEAMSSHIVHQEGVIEYIPKFDEYGIIVHDGGTSKINISFCPWCGKQLPPSRRDEWFDELARGGFDDPWNQDIPVLFHSDLWYRNNG